MRTVLIPLSLSGRTLVVEVGMLIFAAVLALIWELSARRLDDREVSTAAQRKTRARLQTWFRVRAAAGFLVVAVLIATGPGRSSEGGQAVVGTASAMLAAAGGLGFLHAAYRTRQGAR